MKQGDISGRGERYDNIQILKMKLVIAILIKVYYLFCLNLKS